MDDRFYPDGYGPPDRYDWSYGHKTIEAANHDIEADLGIYYSSCEDPRVESYQDRKGRTLYKVTLKA